MCGAGIAIGVAGLVASAVGTGVSVHHQRQQADDIAEMAAIRARAQANEEIINLFLARREKSERVEAFRDEAQQLQFRAAGLRGEAATKFAAGNIQLGTGTPALWEDELMYGLDMDLDTAQENMERDLWKTRLAMAAGSYRAGEQQRVDRIALSQRLDASRVGQIGTALSGAGTVASGFYNLGTQGGWWG